MAQINAVHLSSGTVFSDDAHRQSPISAETIDNAMNPSRLSQSIQFAEKHSLLTDRTRNRDCNIKFSNTEYTICFENVQTLYIITIACMYVCMYVCLYMK